MREFKQYVEDSLNRTFPVPSDDFIETLVNFTAFVAATEGPGIDASQYVDFARTMIVT